jgi:Domain of unknown function (DUF4148)
MTNRRLLNLSFAALAAFGASAAMAQDEGPPLTRAQVLAELHAAQAAGEVPHGDLDISAHNGGADDSPARPPLRVAPSHAKVATDLHQDKKAQM